MPEDPDQEQADRIQLRFDEVNRRVLGEEARTDVLSGNRRAVFSVKPLTRLIRIEMDRPGTLTVLSLPSAAPPDRGALSG